MKDETVAKLVIIFAILFMVFMFGIVALNEPIRDRDAKAFCESKGFEYRSFGCVDEIKEGVFKEVFKVRTRCVEYWIILCQEYEAWGEVG